MHTIWLRLSLWLCVAVAGAKVVTRAVFQLVAKNIFNRTAFDVKAMSNASRNSVSLELQVPADASVGE